MVVIYDQVLRDPPDEATLDEATLWRRLVFLLAKKYFMGVLGLLQYVKPEPEHDSQTHRRKLLQTGTVVLLFNSQDDVRPKLQKALAVPGVKLSEPLEEKFYPGYDGEMIRVMTSMLIDPNGFAIELNQLLRD